ncbi:MAG: pentapeptide repeat-containing protein [Pseudanabaena sp. CAN_BIN31]|nr:pentapeptide repeat-containing protein [Pseudanabaena sp. CAN_BIN31]
MALSFVGQDLRNKSFRGRKDLAGADFTGADLRGCDFREAILVNANFTSAKTNKSRKQLITLITFAFVGAVTVAGMVAFMFVGEGAFVFSVAVTFAIAGWFAFVFTAMFAIAFMFTGVDVVTIAFAIAGAIALAIALAVVIAGQTYNVFLAGKITLGIMNSIICLIALGLAWYFLQVLIKTIKNVTGADFRGADLTGAKFVNANIHVTDFTGAHYDLIDWQGVEFYLCKLPKILEDDRVRYLCRHPDKGRAENYIAADFHRVYLQKADLVDANLQKANFNGADLREAKLTNANLSSSQALGTVFSGATLTGARIANWGINPETKFDNVICTHIYIDEAGQERKPASGDFAEGDFALLVREFANTLDFLFKNEINFSAFQYAMQQMLIKNPEVEMTPDQTKFLGKDKDALRRSYDVLTTEADKTKLHADFYESYDVGKRLYPNDNQQIKDLTRKVSFLEGENHTLKALQAEKNDRIADLREIARLQATKSNDRIIYGQVIGDPMSDKNQNISLNAGGNMTGVTVAGGDISGTVTLTIQQLRDSDTSEAANLADILTDLQKAITDSPELAEPDKEKALKYLDKIGKLANDKEGDRDLIGMAIDGILNVVSKAAKLLTPVQAIAESLRKLLQL